MRTGRSQDSHAFENVMELDGMQRQPSVTGGRGKMDLADTWDEDFIVKDGILMSTSVVIYRSPKEDDDMV